MTLNSQISVFRSLLSIGINGPILGSARYLWSKRQSVTGVHHPVLAAIPARVMLQLAPRPASRIMLGSGSQRSRRL